MNTAEFILFDFSKQYIFLMNFILMTACPSYMLWYVFSLRAVVRWRWKKASQAPSIHHRHSPKEETSLLIYSNFRLLLQPSLCQRIGTRRKYQWMSRKRQILLQRTSLRQSLCGSPFPLCCLSPSPTTALTLIAGTRAAKPMTPAPTAIFITEVGKVAS